MRASVRKVAVLVNEMNVWQFPGDGSSFAVMASKLMAMILVFAGMSSVLGGAELGDPAGEVAVGEWLQGEPVEWKPGSAIYAIAFVATWSSKGRESLPRIAALREEFRARGVRFMAIADETPGKVRKWLKSIDGVDGLPVAIDGESRTLNAYMAAHGILERPYVFVVNREKQVAWHGNEESTLRWALNRILSGRYDLAKARERRRTQQLLEGYLSMITRGETGEKVQRQGEALLEAGNRNPYLLHELATVILRAPAVKTRDFPVAVEASERAYRMTRGRVASIDATYARALHAAGRLEEAIEIQREAVEASRDIRQRRRLASRLVRFVAEQEEGEVLPKGKPAVGAHVPPGQRVR